MDTSHNVCGAASVDGVHNVLDPADVIVVDPLEVHQDFGGVIE